MDSAGPAGARRPAAPSWSHAGTQLAFISDYSPWVMNPDGSNARQLPVGGQVRSVPSWYPDDRLILVAASSFPGQGVLVWLAVDGSGSGTIPVPAGLDPVSPSVSPDGTKVVFAAGYVDESLKGIYVMNLDGSGLRRLTGGFGTDVEPSWSPDGRTIAFTNLYPSPPTVGTARVILVNPDGTGGRLLRHGSISGSWSPDGRFLLVGDPSSGRVLAVRADGSGETALGGCDPLRVSGVSWRPVPGPEARTARAWGWNGVGQLGNGTTVDSRTPAPAGLSGVVSVVGGYYHSLALRDDGSVWAWGWNAVGQLGNGTTADSAAPVRVAGLTGITCLAAGAFHSLAVRVDGTVFTWGWNPFGQLGDGSTSDRSLPQVVPGLAADSVAGGIAHSLALSSDGTVWTWGWNGLGQLGSSSARDSAVPIPVIRRSAGRAPVTAIAAGGHHSLAATENGVLAWGWNQFGQVGEGSTANWFFPVAAQGLYGEITRVAAGGYHSLALRDDGSVFAWG
ncbi:MAG: hypothetical protein M3144_06900, partial [Actinomycetota bacterium]|nr:hypothetical protein [Actinomycetota bacterium]